MCQSLTGYDYALAASEKIAVQYDLCDSCLGRLFAKNLSLLSPVRLGRKLRRDLRVKPCTKCHICRGLFDAIGVICVRIADSVAGYEFATFLAGVTMKPSIVDRDDFVRSKFQLLGSEGIKSAVAREISKSFSRRTGAAYTALAPDLLLTINMKTDSVHVRSRPVFVRGRYVKEERGMPQKVPKCTACGGDGCGKCDRMPQSVEAHISGHLCGVFDAEDAIITWVGGEDNSSLVLGNGRPFFAQMVNPKKRKKRIRRTVLQKGLTLSSADTIKSSPRMPAKFRSQIEITVAASGSVQSARLRELESAAGSQIAVYEKSRRSEKTVYSIKCRKTDRDSVSVSLNVDGGLPVKKFVSGDTVFPNVTDSLGVPCTCTSFDFYGVDLIK